ncbi:MAG: hypothetical protein KC486_23995 [Myxococcales bacterium]|nr:hypothetical protein [Myxococcales bacterium]
MQATTILSKALAAALSLIVVAALGCQARGGPEALSDSDSEASTSGGPTTLGTTTSTVTTAASMTGGVSMGTDTSATSDGLCDNDGVCDEDAGENLANCLHDCATCDVDGVCDETHETPAVCPADCSATACELDGVLDRLHEQCDDNNRANNDACTATCSLNVCGDGFLNEDEGSAEECDDGDLDDGDGCDHLCVRERHTVFVTSESYRGSMAPAIGDLVGLELADAHCDELAASADLPGSYRAWLSAGAGSPGDRFGFPEGFAGRFETTTGEVVADGWEQLTSGALAHGIDRDESGALVDATPVWTNTTIGGAATGADDCDGWTSGDVQAAGAHGTSGEVDGGWTAGGVLPCSLLSRLYCVQVAE